MTDQLFGEEECVICNRKNNVHLPWELIQCDEEIKRESS
jgi:hypothetical protein